MRVVVYVPTYSEKQCRVLQSMAEGIPGAMVKRLQDFRPGEADVGVVFGWWKTAYRPTMAKKPIIEHYGERCLIVESGFQLRGQYYQVGWGGFAGHADFRTKGIKRDRFEAMGIKTKPWKTRPDGPIVVIGQVTHDTQVQDVDHPAWCREAVRFYMERNEYVLFRPHPRIKDWDLYGTIDARYDAQKLKKTLAQAKLVVTWNSTTGVDAVIKGVPLIACDRGAMAWPLAGQKLGAKIRKPRRWPWLAKLGYSQWTEDEMREGLPWFHLSR